MKDNCLVIQFPFYNSVLQLTTVIIVSKLKIFNSLRFRAERFITRSYATRSFCSRIFEYFSKDKAKKGSLKYLKNNYDKSNKHSAMDHWIFVNSFTFFLFLRSHWEIDYPSKVSDPFTRPQAKCLSLKFKH